MAGGARLICTEENILFYITLKLRRKKLLTPPDVLSAESIMRSGATRRAGVLDPRKKPISETAVLKWTIALFNFALYWFIFASTMADCGEYRPYISQLGFREVVEVFAFHCIHACSRRCAFLDLVRMAECPFFMKS